LQYVGHSNGCGVALASINKYQASGKNNAGYYWDTTTGTYQLTDLSSNAIDTFAGEGCPGALNGYSPFYTYFGMFGDKVNNQLNKNHLTAKEVSERLESFCNNNLTGDEKQFCILAAKGLGQVKGDSKVSKNLLLDYLNDIKNTNNQPQVDDGLSINKFRLYTNKDFTKAYRGSIRFILGGGEFDTTQLEHDIVISQKDSQQLSDRISASNSIKLTNYTDFYHGRVSFSDFVQDAEVFLNG